MVRSSKIRAPFPGSGVGGEARPKGPRSEAGRTRRGRNEVEESEAKPETCGPPPRAYKGAAPTPRPRKAKRQRHRGAMTAGARVSGRCARDRSRMAGIRQAEPGCLIPLHRSSDSKDALAGHRVVSEVVIDASTWCPMTSVSQGSRRNDVTVLQPSWRAHLGHRSGKERSASLSRITLLGTPGSCFLH
jgi:hypothetical protein